MSVLANLHSVKNRFLLRVNNAGSDHLRATFPLTFARDVVVVGGCLTVERTLPRALRWLARNRARLLAKRHEILGAAHGFRPRAPALVRPRPGGRPDSGPGRVRVAILGTRGVPAAYGGFETLAEELSVRLARRGHDVTVYARRGCVRGELSSFLGVRVVFTPTIRHKYLDTVVHGVTSGLHAAVEGYDAVLVCNGANALSCRLPRLLGAGTRVLLNVDGLERNRRKWNRLGKAVYAVSERLSCVLPDVVVTDAKEIRRYYLERYGRESAFVPYGSDLPRAGGPLDPRPARARERRLRPLRLALRAREQPRRRRPGLSRRPRRAAPRPRRLGPVRREVHHPPEGRGREGPARPPAGGGLRGRIPGPSRARVGLRPRDRGRRDAPRPHRGDGVRPARPRPTTPPRTGRWPATPPSGGTPATRRP